VGCLDVVGARVSPKTDGPSLGAGVGTLDGKADSVFEGSCDGWFDVEGGALGPAEGSWELEGEVVGWLDVVGARVSPNDDGRSLGAGVGTAEGKPDKVFEGCCDG
jgi:hypothetical protein